MAPSADLSFRFHYFAITALERAILIASGQDTHLLNVHVFEEFDEATQSYGRNAVPSWQRPPDVVAITKQRIRLVGGPAR